MNKLIKNGIIICGSAILLASCSSEGKDSKETNSKNIKMGDIFNNENEHISYILDDDNPIEKGTVIDYYIVSKDGKAKIYDGTGDTTLGDISKMSTKKIKDRMKKEDEEWFKKDKKETIDSLKEGTNKVSEINKGYSGNENDPQEKSAFKYTKDYIDKHGNVPQKYLDKIKKINYTEPKAEPIKLALKTDGSGNSSKSETFKFKAHGFSIGSIDEPENTESKEYYFTDSSVTKTASFENDLSLEKKYEDTVAVTDIYDKKFAGLSAIDEDDSDDVNYLITEVGDKTKEVKLDSPKDKYVNTVDGDKK